MNCRHSPISWHQSYAQASEVATSLNFTCKLKNPLLSMKSKRSTSGSAEPQQRRTVLWPHQTSHLWRSKWTLRDWVHFHVVPAATPHQGESQPLSKNCHPFEKAYMPFTKQYFQNCILMKHISTYLDYICFPPPSPVPNCQQKLLLPFCLKWSPLYFHGACVYACVKPILYTWEKNMLWVCLSCYGWLHSIWQVSIIPCM